MTMLSEFLRVVSEKDTIVMLLFGVLTTVVAYQALLLSNQQKSLVTSDSVNGKQQVDPNRATTKCNKNNHTTIETTTDTNDDGAVALRLIQTRRSIFPKQYSTSQPNVPDSVLHDMLEAARWAPTHKLTQPWRFVVFSSTDAKTRLATFLADHYRRTTSPEKYNEKKEEKKKTSVLKSSHVVAICVVLPDSRPVPHVEEVCSVAMAVQNMHLVASAHKIGAYWSSSAVYQKTDKTPPLKKENGTVVTNPSEASLSVVNPPELREFLNLAQFETNPSPDKDDSTTATSVALCLCLGWLFVGNLDDKQKQKWPASRRESMDHQKVIWC